MLSSTMPITVGVMCEKCERIYLLAHLDSPKRIQFTPGSDPHPRYRLTCICKVERHFDSAQTKPYRVSGYACSKGYADRDEYDVIPNQKPSMEREHSR